MLVYGDHAERVNTRLRLERLAAACERISAMRPGLARHSALIGAFVSAAGLTQGVADALFADEGADRRSEAQDACMTLLLGLAGAVRASWDSGFEKAGVLPDPALAAPLPAEVDVRLPEGYAFYALYPEAYVEAARRLRLSGPTRVIGIRSIGAGLGALVASALGCGAPVTLRPVGHPFDRRLSLAPELADELVADTGANFVVVDEGPGLSGSSFGAVADFLEDSGVARERIHFLSGHGGDLGPHASARHRERWGSATREAADTGGWLTEQLTAWVNEAFGPLDEPLTEVSGGGWRSRRLRREDQWPAVAPIWERRKFLARVGGETWLLKFAGLGEIGERKLARARMLHAAGFAPEPRGLVHGFLAERWIEDAEPLPPGGSPPADIRRIGSYLGFRARMFAREDAGGAPLDEMLRMARHNITEEMGSELAAALDPWEARLGRLATLESRIETDGRCLPHEWLRLPDGRLVKADGLDHHLAHDLVGCQDVAWDVAGAAVELDLDVDALARIVAEAAGRPVEKELIEFFTPCYLAFRLGCHRIAMQMLVGWPEEAARNEAAADRYAAKLQRLLATASSGDVGAGKQEALCVLR